MDGAIKRFKPFRNAGYVATALTGDPTYSLVGPYIDDWGRYITSSKKRKMAVYPKNRKLSRVAGAGVKNERGASDRLPTVKKGKKKPSVSFKQGKNLKVSKQFKAKVSKVIESKKIHGTVEIISYGVLPRASQNAQAYGHALTGESYGGTPYTTQSSYQMWAFAPEWFLSCASVLFNKKPYIYQLAGTGNATMRWFDGDQIGAGNAQGADNYESANPSTGGMAIFGNNAKFTVSSAWEKYLLRNNSQRTMTVKIYLCAPKRIGALQEDINVSAAGTSATSGDYITDPGVTWEKGMDLEYGLGKNLNGVLPTFIHLSPLENSQFKKEYKAEVTTIVLEPGQSYDYFIPGPKNLEINYANMFKNNLHMYIQKCMRYPLFVVHSDLIGCRSGTESSNLTAGVRAAAPNYALSGAGVVVERRRFCRISLPEKAGMRIDSSLAIGSVQLGFHRPAYFKSMIPGIIAADAGFTRVDDENPVPVAGSANVIV